MNCDAIRRDAKKAVRTDSVGVNWDLDSVTIAILYKPRHFPLSV
jgi:hypothetical protein